jgi:hypothetical protein
MHLKGSKDVVEVGSEYTITGLNKKTQVQTKQ